MMKFGNPKVCTPVLQNHELEYQINLAVRNRGASLNFYATDRESGDRLFPKITFAPGSVSSAVIGIDRATEIMDMSDIRGGPAAAA
jgi:hypothetical protein